MPLPFENLFDQIAKGNLQQSLNKLETQVTGNQEPKLYVKLIILKSNILRRLHDFNTALNTLNLLMETNSTTIEENPEIHSNYLIELAYVHWFLIDYAKTEQLLDQARNIIDSHNIPQPTKDYIFADLIMLEANIYAKLGLYQDAINKYLTSLKIKEKKNVDPDIAMIYSNIGTVYSYLGRLEEAKDWHNKALQLGIKLENEIEIAMSNCFIGLAIYQLGNTDEGIDRLERGLSSLLEKERSRYVSEFLMYLIGFTSEEGKWDLAERYFNQIEEIAMKTSDVLSRVYYKYARGIYYMNKPRLEDKVTGARILLEIARGPVIELDLKIRAIKNYTDYLIDEFRLYKNQEVYDQIVLFVNSLFDIGQQEGIIPVLVQSLVLKAHLALIDGEIDNSIEMLNNSQVLIDKHGDNLKNSVIKEHQRLLHQMDQYKSFSSKVEKIVELNRAQDYLRDVTRFLND